MTDMYICLCNAVRKSQIELAILEDADITLEGLQEKLEVAMNCGACNSDVLKILECSRQPK